MKNQLYDRIWRRESGDLSQYTSIRGIYGSKEWVDDLDIVNELGGHTGCVNALRYVGPASLDLRTGCDVFGSVSNTKLAGLALVDCWLRDPTTYT